MRSWTARIFLTLVVILLALQGVAVAKAIEFERDTRIGRNLIVALVAQSRKGEEMPFETDYSPNSGGMYGGIATNSTWLSDYARMIVPYMQYEDVNPRPRYPMTLYFAPQRGYDSFHLGGYAKSVSGVVVLNERFVVGPRWNDEAATLSTLVHELVHVQLGLFAWGPDAQVESNTSAATMEVLAAMCNYGDKVACRGFWMDVEGAARSSVHYELRRRGFESVYQFVSNILFRDSDEQLAAAKALRFWEANAPGSLTAIIERYGASPWTDHVAPGVCGDNLNTGHIVSESEGTYSGPPETSYYVLGMPFDDVRAQFGPLLESFVRLTGC